MSRKGVVFHELSGNLLRQRAIETSSHVDARQLALLGFRNRAQYEALALKISFLRVGLRMDGDELACRHRHRSGDKARSSGHQNTGVTDLSRGHPDHQACRRDDAVIGPQYSGTQPACTVSPMTFGMQSGVMKFYWRSIGCISSFGQFRCDANSPQNQNRFRSCFQFHLTGIEGSRLVDL